MNLKGWAISMGIGAAIGAVAILAMPRNNITRRLATEAAEKVEDAATAVGDMISDKMDL